MINGPSSYQKNNVVIHLKALNLLCFSTLNFYDVKFGPLFLNGRKLYLWQQVIDGPDSFCFVKSFWLYLVQCSVVQIIVYILHYLCTNNTTIMINILQREDTHQRYITLFTDKHLSLCDLLSSSDYWFIVTENCRLLCTGAIQNSFIMMIALSNTMKMLLGQNFDMKTWLRDSSNL